MKEAKQEEEQFVIWKLAAAYLIFLNLVTFIVYFADKRLAKSGGYRVPERTLLLLSAIGGSVGALAAMRLFRHKTLHKRFSVGVPLMLIAHLAIAAILFYLFR